MENQHIASNLTVRVSHDLLRAGAMCRVSNALGVSEKHIQLLGEPRLPPFLLCLLCATKSHAAFLPGEGASCICCSSPCSDSG